MSHSASIVVLACLAALCKSLYVASGSPCTSDCNAGPGKGTFYTDLVCADEDFSQTSKGQTLKSCMSCLSTSTYVNDTQTDGNTDEFWFVFHMKYVQQSCIIDKSLPNYQVTDPCSDQCSSLKDPLDELWINKHPFHAQYYYCSQNSSVYPNNAPECATCLQGNNGSQIIGNMVDTMSNACADKPMAENGALLSVRGDLFATSTASASSTSSTSSASSSSPTSSSTSSSGKPTSTSASSSTSSTQTSAVAGAPGAAGSSSPNHDLSTGAALGIGLGVGLTGLALIIFGAVYLLRRRKSVAERSQPESVRFFEKGSAGPTPIRSELEYKSTSRFVEAPDYHHISEVDGYPQAELEAPFAPPYKR